MHLGNCGYPPLEFITGKSVWCGIKELHLKRFLSSSRAFFLLTILQFSKFPHPWTPPPVKQGPCIKSKRTFTQVWQWIQQDRSDPTKGKIISIYLNLDGTKKARGCQYKMKPHCLLIQRQYIENFREFLQTRRIGFWEHGWSPTSN